MLLLLLLSDVTPRKTKSMVAGIVEMEKFNIVKHFQRNFGVFFADLSFFNSLLLIGVIETARSWKARMRKRMIPPRARVSW